ncbi:hypothetical protein [Actinomycetospora lemnae]|uniref:hypothetical protein n=1 Tax=Actinomycetospora lemnae TaxID=3019891 RepID=UPI0023667E4D|nr:hypothetical protein [Actinomycetospora sp. DW7H6]
MPACLERSLAHEPSTEPVIAIDEAAREGGGLPAPARDRPDRDDHLLVGVRDETDVQTTLAEAVDRARCEDRALLVALVRPQAPLSTDAVMQQRAADRATRDLVRRRVLVRAMCAEAGVRLDDIRTIAQPWRLGARGRERALRRRLHALARTLGAELHPLPPRHGGDDVSHAQHRPASTRPPFSTPLDDAGLR